MCRRRLLAACLVAALVVLAGCGGGLGSGEPATVADPTPTSTATPTPADGGANATGTVEVHFINVEQSVSTLIVGPTGEAMLIDTGDFTDDGEHVLRYLRAHGVDRIDHLVVSHDDADHIGGNAAIIEHYETEADGVGAVYDPGIPASTATYEAYLDAVEAHDVTLYETREGDAIPFEGVDVTVLGPPEPYLEDRARNENSIVLRLAFGNTSFLLTGDAEDDQEAYLVENYGDGLNATVLKAGHHGSNTSTGGPLLDAAAPRAVVVSSAYHSRYGHPHEETLRRLADRDLPAYWTATHGDVVLVSDGAGVSVRTEHDAPTDPLALREAEPDDPTALDDVVERARLDGGGPGANATTTPTPTPTSTQTPTPTLTPAPDGGTAGGEPALVEVNADAEGNDHENLNDEYVVLENAGDDPLNLSGWTLRDEAGHEYTFPDGAALDPGDRVTVRTGSGTDADSDRYWGRSRAVWNNDGDTVIVTTPAGERAIEESYS
jgi:competence protein ComEC